jgi:hypothetical protein
VGEEASGTGAQGLGAGLGKHVLFLAAAARRYHHHPTPLGAQRRKFSRGRADIAGFLKRPVMLSFPSATNRPDSRNGPEGTMFFPSIRRATSANVLASRRAGKDRPSPSDLCWTCDSLYTLPIPSRGNNHDRPEGAGAAGEAPGRVGRGVGEGTSTVGADAVDRRRRADTRDGRSPVPRSNPADDYSRQLGAGGDGPRVSPSGQAVAGPPWPRR